MAHYLMSVKYWHRYHRYGLITSVTTLGDSFSLSGITAVLLMIGLRQVRTDNISIEELNRLLNRKRNTSLIAASLDMGVLMKLMALTNIGLAITAAVLVSTYEYDSYDSECTRLVTAYSHEIHTIYFLLPRTGVFCNLVEHSKLYLTLRKRPLILIRCPFSNHKHYQ